MFFCLGAEFGVCHERVAVMDRQCAAFAYAYENRVGQYPIKKLPILIEQRGKFACRQRFNEIATLLSCVRCCGWPYGGDL
jgi:hypothetical protein